MNKLLLPVVFCAASFSAYAQQTSSLTAKDYVHAESFLNYNTEQLVDHGAVSPAWITGDLFWYRVLTSTGSEFILVNPAKGTRSAAFDQQQLAAALSAATGKKYEANLLPFHTLVFSPDLKSITFDADDKQWNYDLSNHTCTVNTHPVRIAATRRTNSTEVVSPDGKKAAYIQDYNLWIRDLATKEKTQLTTDGIKDFGYATDNAGWKHSDKAVIRWSPDSRKIATFKQDQRKVSDMYLVTTNVGKPTLKAWKYPLPGDPVIATIQRVVIDTEHPKVIVMQVDPDAHRATLSDDISSGENGLDDVDWNEDASVLAFVSTSRDHKQEKFRIADAATGTVRNVFEETAATQFESGQGSINWRYLQRSNEIIWYSERDDHGHLYLYDAVTGKVKNQITKGSWTVTKLLKVDEKKRVLYFLADGREPGNPYFSHLYKIGFDGKHLVSLTPENGNHQVTLSPSANYFVDSYSQHNVPPVSVLRNLDGKLVTSLEKTDISRLKASGWKAPTPIIVKAHDGQTDLYGVMFSPTNLDSTKKYPIINHIYPGPQGGSVGSWSFSASKGDDQALAELGFIVVEIEGSSNPLRSKSYHDMNYGNIADNTLPDQITGMQQLAKRYPYIDIELAGIWGHSGGGFATAAAMFRYPDFFKVGISESGNHDNRNYEDDWGERYIGLLTQQPDGTSNYEAQANENYAKNLKGKLMLAHGMLDDNVPPYNTLLVVEALEKANKDYDLVIFPNSPHGYGAYSPYMMRRRWDYFVRYLKGVEPPHEYELKTTVDPRNAVK
ncbi:S9 family peptidase [Pedobacter sp. L105]|uniref:S9 family peptidase n=1 Tax=Pedobacter sp. L105 TaxID=1641871 RepID=UPI00131C474C|nr:S9 family peptidase [Pedobacter sp. L105]